MRTLPLLLILISTLGCQQPTVPAAPERSTYFSRTTPDTDTTTQTLRVEAPDSAVLALHQWLGDSNRVTVAKPLKITQSGLTIDVPAGATVDYTLSAERGTFVFADPRPTIAAKVFGFSVAPRLERVELFADNRGTATAALGPVRQRHEFTLAWQSPAAPAEAAPVKPVVYAWSTANCRYCVPAKDALAKAQDLPFTVVWDPPGKAAPAGLFPCFSWQAASGQTHVETGWLSLAHLLNRWKATTTPPANVSASAGFDLRQAARHPVAYYEMDGQRRLRDTSLTHLIRDHGVDSAALQPFIGQPEALNRIHGWLHTHADGK